MVCISHHDTQNISLTCTFPGKELLFYKIKEFLDDKKAVHDRNSARATPEVTQFLFHISFASDHCKFLGA
jgi:hypothetical protein